MLIFLVHGVEHRAQKLGITAVYTVRVGAVLLVKPKWHLSHQMHGTGAFALWEQCWWNWSKSILPDTPHIRLFSSWPAVIGSRPPSSFAEDKTLLGNIPLDFNFMEIGLPVNDVTYFWDNYYVGQCFSNLFQAEDHTIAKMYLFNQKWHVLDKNYFISSTPVEWLTVMSLSWALNQSALLSDLNEKCLSP